jgi:2'-5' RNA ligase
VAADSQPDYTGSCMIALYPPGEVAAALSVPDGLDPDETHLTIAYTGDAADVDPEALNAAAKALAGRAPFTAAIAGHARFTGGTQDCIVALADAPELETLRSDARAALAEQGIGIPSEHGFTAHMTIKYVGEDEPDPVGRLAAFPVTFSAISAVHGKDRTDYPFSDDLASVAAEAYFSGWALTGAPLTERVKAGCTAAVEVTRDHRDDPRILETALGLGHLEGVQALVQGRRNRLIAKHLKTATTAWDACIKPLDARKLATRFRSAAYVTTESASPDTQFWREAGTAAALGWLRAIYTSDGYDALVAATEDAIRSGMAEGEADALALAAARLGKTGFRIADAFKAAYARLADDHTITALAAAVLTQIIDSAGGDLGRRLAALAGDGAGEDDMAAAVSEVTTEARSLKTWLADAIWGAIGTAAVALYTLAGVGVDWDADEGACPACAANAAASPYSPANVPGFPGHPRCRCELSTRSRLPLSLLTPFLP